MARPIAIDLFAGAGGLSLSFEWAGFDVKAAVELDPIHCATHEFNFPNCKTICSSVADIAGADILKRANISQQVDVVCGGAPCQGFSLIGKRAMDDPRNSLVFHFVRLVKEINPKYFVFENVKGLTVGKHKQFLNEIIDAFEEIGYKVKVPYQVYNAADFGVPQNRHRLFLIGCKKNRKLPLEPIKREPVTVQEAIGDLPELDNFEELLKDDSVKAKYKKSSEYARQLREQGNRVENHYGYRRAYNPKLLTSSMRTIHTDLSRERFAATEHGSTEPVSRFFKLDPNGVCNTLRAGTASDRGAFTSPRPIHPHTPRCISVREAARLHSYPDWFRFHKTKWHGMRQIGNSVPPYLGQAVASSVIEALGVKPNRPTKVLKTGNAILISSNMAQAAAYYGVAHDTIPQRTRKKQFAKA